MPSPAGTSSDPFVWAANFGGLTSLRLRHDKYPTEYIRPGETLGDVILNVRSDAGAWREMRAFGSGDVRKAPPTGARDAQSVVVAYRGDSQGVYGLRGLDLTVAFTKRAACLDWSLTLRNRTDRDLEIGDIALPMPFNNDFRGGNRENYTAVVARQGCIAGHGSFQVWLRGNGEGPFLVMTPLPGTKLEYYEQLPQGQHLPTVPYRVFIHSRATGANTPGTWRQPHTSAVLGPQGSQNDALTYGFRFRWAQDHAEVRQILFDEGGCDVWVAPGMTVPEDMELRVSIRTRHRDYRLVPEHPDQTSIVPIESPDPTRDLYRIVFARLGENLITVRYGQDQYCLLEFFVTESIATLLEKRCQFLVNKQQHRDPEQWYDGLFSLWDLREATLRSPHDTDGFDAWMGYVLCCDDPALPKAPFLALKNVYRPNRDQVEAIEYYIERFVWGKLQRTDQEEPWPFGIYGVPNWFENRFHEHGWNSGGRGLEHIWRSYDYPHVIMLYYHMHEIAQAHPDWVRHADAAEYLHRAYGTARTFFEMQAQIDFLPADRNPYWAYTLGMYNELTIELLCDTLAEQGWQEEEQWLRREWERKIRYFVYDDPYPFDSEHPHDTTAFESTYVFARYGLERDVLPDESGWFDQRLQKRHTYPKVERADFEDFLHRQARANIALRGWLEPAFYLMGSDNRNGDSTTYGLSYMSQAGGWPLLEYGLRYAEDTYGMVNLGYASLLSSWALMNTGTAETHYGYWHPGPDQDGACGWAFTPEKQSWTWLRRQNQRGPWFYDGEIEIGLGAALRGMCTVLVDDPIFGLYAYGGTLETTADGLRVYPCDGLNRRFFNLTAQFELQTESSPASVPVAAWTLASRTNQS